MKNIDILLISPPSGRQKEFEKTIGLAYIEAYLNKNNYLTKQLIPNSMNMSEIINQIMEIRPKIIGFSCYDMNYYYVKLLSKKIKQKLNIPIIIGGPTATFSYKTIIKEFKNSVDYIVRGYGEIPIYELMNHILRNNVDIANIPSIVYRSNNKIIINDMLTIPDNIDVFPSPYLSNIDFYPERKIVFSSRGCFHNCAYCNCATMCNRKVYYHSIERVVDELEYISKKSPNAYVLIGDDAFTLNVSRAKKICRIIIEKQIHLRLFCETRADKIDLELLQLLKDAGFIKIDFGLESSVPKILRNVEKVFYTKDDDKFASEKKFVTNMKKIIKYCKELSLDPMVNIISGLPGETLNDAKKTLKYIEKLKINSYSHNYLRIYSGTKIYYDYKKWNYKIKNSKFGLPLIIKYPIDIKKITPLNNSVSRSEIVRLKKALISIWKNKLYYTVNTIKNIKNLDMNEEIFVLVMNKREINNSLNAVIESEIATNNVVFIEKKRKNYYCYNYLDKDNYIVIKTITNEKFTIPKNYYTLLYVEKMTSLIENRFNKLKVNPKINRFILTNDSTNITIKNIIDDYIKTYSSNKEIIYKFSEYINYDYENLDISLFERIIDDNVFTLEEINIIKRFLKYYLLGVIDER